MSIISLFCYFSFRLPICQVREKGESILLNLQQYNCDKFYVDILVSDFSNSIWHKKVQFDSIITDRTYMNSNIIPINPNSSIQKLNVDWNLQHRTVYARHEKRLKRKSIGHWDRMPLMWCIIHRRHRMSYRAYMTICCVLLVSIYALVDDWFVGFQFLGAYFQFGRSGFISSGLLLYCINSCSIFI